MYSRQFEEQLREYGINNLLEGSSSYGYTFDEWNSMADKNLEQTIGLIRQYLPQVIPAADVMSE